MKTSQKRIKAILLFCSLVIVAGGTIVAGFLPAIKEAFKEVPHIVFLTKLLLSLPGLFIALFSFIAGRFADLYGRKKLLIVSLLVYSFSASTGIYLENIYWILVARCLMGIALGCVMTAAGALIGDYFEGEARNKFMGAYSGMMSFGAVFFLLSAGVLADINWHLPFYLYLLPLVCAYVSYLYLVEPNRKKEVLTGLSVLPPAKVKAPKKMLFLIFSIGLIGMIIYFVLPIQMPYLLREFDGTISNSKIALVGGLLTLTGGFAALGHRYLVRQFSFATIFSFIFFIMAVSFIGIGKSTHFLTILLLAGLCGIGSGLFLSNINLWLLSIVSAENRGFFMGLLTSILFFGQFLSPFIVELMVRASSISGVFFMTGLFLCLLGIFMLVYALGMKNQHKKQLLAKIA